MIAHSSTVSNNLPEHEALRRARNGDASGFERLYRLHSGRVHSMCLKMVANSAEADDLTQESFLRAFRKIGTFRGDSSFGTWLYRLSFNVVLGELRKKKPGKESSGGLLSPDSEAEAKNLEQETAGPDPSLAGLLDRLNLDRAMQRLSAGQKIVFLLHDVHGYKHTEIAEIMDWSIGTSKGRLHKARMRLRALLQGALASPHSQIC